MRMVTAVLSVSANACTGSISASEELTQSGHSPAQPVAAGDGLHSRCGVPVFKGSSTHSGTAPSIAASVIALSVIAQHRVCPVTIQSEHHLVATRGGPYRGARKGAGREK